MSRSFHINTAEIKKLLKKYGKLGPFPSKAIKLINQFALKSKTKRKVLKERKISKSKENFLQDLVRN